MVDDDEQVWDVGLGLSIGLGDQYYVPKKEEHKNKRVACLGLSLRLDPKDEELAVDHRSELCKTEMEGIFFSSNTNLEEEQNDAANGVKHKKCSRIKRRLTKEQTSMLEDSFKLHTTLTTVQKQALAERLNLKPRQVEVWFQNRRARTKLKQTEVDCGFLKKCSENLSDENQRLKKEIQELVASKLEQPAPLYIQLPKAATLTMCPSCHKIFKVGGDDAEKIVAAVMEGCAPLHEPYIIKP